MAEGAPSKPDVVAKVEFITWKYPPYCELCNVYFPGEACSKAHFEGKSHKNSLHIWRKYQDPQPAAETPTKSKEVPCLVCWKMLNTQNMLDIHNQSAAHLKEEQARVIVQNLKEQYRQLKELHGTKK